MIAGSVDREPLIVGAEREQGADVVACYCFELVELKVPGLRFSHDAKLLSRDALLDADFGVGSVRSLFGPIS